MVFTTWKVYIAISLCAMRLNELLQSALSSHENLVIFSSRFDSLILLNS